MGRGDRNKRRNPTGNRTESLARISLTVLAEEARRYPEETAHLRPKNRSQCVNGPRPCPFVSCRYNTYLDVGVNGNIKVNRPDIEPHEVAPHVSCALDSKEPLSLEDAGAVFNVVRERIRQIENRALNTMSESGLLAEFADTTPAPQKKKKRPWGSGAPRDKNLLRMRLISRDELKQLLINLKNGR